MGVEAGVVGAEDDDFSGLIGGDDEGNAEVVEQLRQAIGVDAAQGFELIRCRDGRICHFVRSIL